MNINLKLLHENAVIPQYSRNGDCGLDLTAVSLKVTKTEGYEYLEYDIGIAIEVPEGYVGLIFPRSSISETALVLANAVGVIEPNYRGSLKCRFKHIDGETIYEVGDRVAQILFVPILMNINFNPVDNLTETNRGELGFGSSGK